MSLFAVIMAGGGGTRLWPVSRRARPKQSLRILGERTLFQGTVDRLDGLVPPDQILVATVADQADALRAQAPFIPADNFLIEPEPKGTASVIGLAALEIRHRHSEAVMACLPADHFIGHAERFRTALEEAGHMAAQGYLVTLGIQPTAPETGYGYLEAGPELAEYEPLPAFRVESFKEKPSPDLAATYAQTGKHFWNAGIFVWSAGTILDEIARWMPELHAVLEGLERGRGQPGFDLPDLWGKLESETIDYGVMEHAERTSMVAVEDLGWWDVGSWNRLLDVLPGDAEGNVILASNVEVMQSRDTLLYQLDDQKAARLLALIGVENLIVVDTGDALLIASRDQAQKVRELVKRLAEAGKEKYL